MLLVNVHLSIYALWVHRYISGGIKTVSLIKGGFTAFRHTHLFQNIQRAKVYLCTDNLRPEEENTSEAASTIWSTYCTSSLLLASACSTEMTNVSAAIV